MDTDLAARLLTSIESDRLVIFSGAGLSMADPSRVPSAFQLAQTCASRYKEITGVSVPAGADSNLEALADFFLEQHTLSTVFLDRLVVWAPFREPQNAAHSAIADFLASTVVEYAATTNVDVLVESAAQQLGEPDFRPALDGLETMRSTAHKPYLKLHGCMERDRDATVWTRRQLDSTDANANATVMTRLATSSTWLQANLVNRDVVFIGFWSDWRYLNDVLQSALATSTPTMVVVVDPASPEVLQQKAPELWNWCHQGGIDFFHERQSGKEFLADLRRIFSQRLLERVLIDSLQLFDAMSKGAVQPDTTFADITSNEELYQIRKDMSSAPRRDVPRKKRPDPSMREAGAIHLLVRQKGGRLQGSRYLLNTHTIRVLNGGHRPMNRVRAEFGNDGANVEDEMIICSDAFDDGGVPSDLMGRSEVTSIVRSVSRSTWLTWQQARGRDLI